MTPARCTGLLAGLLVACAGRPAPAPPPPPPPPPSATASPAPSPANGAPPYVVPEPSALAQKPLTPDDGEPFEKLALPSPTAIGRGAVMAPGIEGPPRVVIATKDEGAVVDVRTGRTTLELPSKPTYVSAKAGVVTLDGQPPRLARLKDMVVVTPRIASAGPLREVRLAASDHYRVPIAVAKSSAGTAWAGTGSDDSMNFELHELPFAAGVADVGAILNAHDSWQLVARSRPALTGGTPYPFAADPAGACHKLRMSDHGEIQCLELVGANAGPTGTRWLAEGWFSGGDYVSHVGWEGKRIELEALAAEPKSRCLTRATRDSPPRVVITCHGSQRAFLWVPGALLSFKGPSDPNDLGGLLAADSGPVLPLLERETQGDYVQRWLDLLTPALLSSSPLRPLGIAPFSGVGERALAEARSEKGSEVYLLDFEARTQRKVARIDDCSGQLAELDPVGRYLVLACVTKAPPGTVRHSLIWSEVVDPERKLRFRSKLLPELAFADGSLVLANRRALTAEVGKHPSKIYYVDPTR